MTSFPTLRRLGGPAGTIAVTIDDGPNPGTTPALLEVLDAHGAKASFFACGTNLEKFPDLAAAMVARGHGVFSHAYDHTALDTLAAAAVVSQLERTDRLLSHLRPSAGAPLVRFPYGAGAEDPAVRAAVAAWRPDTVAVQWSLCAQEWEFIDGCPTPEAARAATADAVRRLAATEDWDRAIILMHDWPNAAAFCAGLLDAFLAEIARRGLSPVVLSDTLGPPIRGTGECNCRP